MWMLIEIALLLGLGFAQGISPALGSIRDVVTKGTNGEPAVLPAARILLRRPITNEAESDTQGAFAIDGPPPGTSEIETDALGLYAAFTVEVRAGTSFTVPVQVNVAAVTSTMSPQLTQLKAMDCAFSRKVQHA